jgi:hypothetical protein
LAIPPGGLFRSRAKADFEFVLYHILAARAGEAIRDLATAIPDVEVRLALEPEELGAKLLFLVKARYGSGMFHPGQMQSDRFQTRCCIWSFED